MFSNTIKDFEKRGIFSLSVFEQIFTGDDILTSSKFIALMEHLHIAAPLHEGGVVTKYFLPCALTHADLPPDTEEGSVVPPLLVTFDSGYCPRGVFGSLVVDLMKKEKEQSEFNGSLSKTRSIAIRSKCPWVLTNRLDFVCNHGTYESISCFLLPKDEDYLSVVSVAMSVIVFMRVLEK